MRALLNLLMVILSFLLAYWVHFGLKPIINDYLVVLLYAIFIALLFLPATGAFQAEFRFALFRRLRRSLASWVAIVIFLIITAAALKITENYSRIWFVYWALFGAVGFVLVEIFAQTLQTNFSYFRGPAQKIVLVGAGSAAAVVERRIQSDPISDVEIMARFGNPWTKSATRPIAELSDYVSKQDIAAVWVAVPWEERGLLDAVMEAIRDISIEVKVVPDLFQYRMLSQGIAEYKGLPVISFSKSPPTGAERIIKVVFDRLAAIFLLIVFLPLLLLIGLLVKATSSGPVLSRHRRYGISNDVIEVVKFRTRAQLKKASGKPNRATQDDPRHTVIGRLLRRTRLDGLPQIYCVLRGDMSLVGPRPHAAEHNEHYKNRIPKYMLRHQIKAGITDWAQINGMRGEADTEGQISRRIEYDLYYIQHWSLWLDLKILLLTPLVILFQKNAY